MSGRGKGGKGLGFHGAKRYRRSAAKTKLSGAERAMQAMMKRVNDNSKEKSAKSSTSSSSKASKSAKVSKAVEPTSNVESSNLRRSSRVRHSLTPMNELVSAKVGEIRFGEEEIVAVRFDAPKERKNNNRKTRKSSKKVKEPEAETPAQEDVLPFRLAQLSTDIVVGDEADVVIQVEWLQPVAGAALTFQVSQPKDSENEDDDNANTSGVEIGSILCSVTDKVADIEEGKIRLSSEGLARIKAKLENAEDGDSDGANVGDAAYARRLRARYRRLQRDDGGTDEDDAASEEDDESEEDEDGGRKGRKRKRGKKTSSSAKKNKKTALTPRPSVPQVDDLFLRKTGKLELFEGDSSRVGKEVIRAVLAGDQKALNMAVKNKDVVYSLHAPHFPDFPVSALQYALAKNDLETAKILREDWTERFSLPTPMLGEATTGKHTSRYSRYNRRKLNASRGGKEGNNAFLKDTQETHVSGLDIFEEGPDKDSSELSFVPCWVALMDSMSTEALSSLHASGIGFEAEKVVEELVNSGDRLLAAQALTDLISWNTSFSNFLHLESLKDEGNGKFSKPFRSTQVLKKSGTMSRFTPLHTAALNPNVGFLKELLVIAPSAYMAVDKRNRNLVHFASTSESDNVLRYLLTNYGSLDRTLPDSQGLTPVLAAAMCARPANVRALFEGVEEETKRLMHASQYKGLSALHWASLTKRKGGPESVRVLLEFGASPEVTTTATRNRVTPAHYAAMMGNLEILEVLAEAGAPLNAKDKLKRTPAILAAKNGHAHVLAFLLKAGVDVDVADSSGNTALMYAAAYGWHECVELLLDHGKVDPNAANAWKSTALSLAVQKHHPVVTSMLLRRPDVDVNFVNENGETLLFSLVSQYIEKLNNMTSYQQETTSSSSKKKSNDNNKEGDMEVDSETADDVKGKKKKPQKKSKKKDDSERETLLKDLPSAFRLLLDKEKCKVGVANVDGKTELHIIALHAKPRCEAAQRKVLALLDLLVENGADINGVDNEGISVLSQAAASRNTSLVRHLIERGATLTVDAKKRTLLHCLTQSCAEGTFELLELLADTVPQEVVKMCETLDSSGATPVHNVAQLLVKAVESQTKEDQSLLEKVLVFLLAKNPRAAEISIAPPHASVELEIEWDSKGRMDEETLLNKLSMWANKDGGKEENEQEKAEEEEEEEEEEEDDVELGLQCNNITRILRERLEKLANDDSYMTVDCIDKILEQYAETASLTHSDLRNAGLSMYYMRDQVLQLICNVERENNQEDNKKSKKSKKSKKGKRKGESKGSRLQKASKVPSDETHGKTLLHILAALPFTQEAVSTLRKVLEAIPESVRKALCGSTDAGDCTALQRLLTNFATFASSTKADAKEPSEQACLSLIGLLVDGGCATVEEARAPLFFPFENETQAHSFSHSAAQDQELCKELWNLYSSRSEEFRFDEVYRMLKMARLREKTKAEWQPYFVVTHLLGHVTVSFLEAMRDDLKFSFNLVVAKGDTLLHLAAKVGCLESVKFLCSATPASVSQPNAFGKLPLHIAAILDNTDILKALLAHDSSPAVLEFRDRHGMTPFLYSVAVATEREEQLLETSETLLLEAGADVSAVDNNGWNALHYVFIGSQGKEMYNFPHCFTDSHVDPIELVSTICNAPRGHDAVVCKDKSQRTPLHYAAAVGAGVSCLLLLKRGALLYQHDKDGNSPLALTILRKHVMLAIMLMKTGSPEDRGDLVTQHKVTDIKRGLLLKGKDLQDVETIVTSTGREVKVKVTSKHVETCFWHAASNQFEGLVYVLLDEYPYDVAIADALRCGSFKLARKLLATCRQSDLETRIEGSNFTLLHEVAQTVTEERQWIQVLGELLIRRGVDPNATCAKGRTALFYAAARNHLDLCKAFVAQGVDPAQRDHSGYTPFLYALESTVDSGAMSKHTEILLYLLSASKEDLSTAKIQVHREQEILLSEPFKVEAGPNVETVLEALHNPKPASDNKRRALMSTPLNEAVFSRNLALLPGFLDANADMMQTDQDGLTPLHQAILLTDIKSVCNLLALGASVQQLAGNEVKLPPLVLATHNFFNSCGEKDAFRMIQILLHHGARLEDAGPDGLTALHIAARNNELSLVELFLGAAYSSTVPRKMTAKLASLSKQPVEGNAIQRVWVLFGEDWIFGVRTATQLLLHVLALKQTLDWSEDWDGFRRTMAAQVGEGKDGALLADITGLESAKPSPDTWLALPLEAGLTTVPVHTHPLVGPVKDDSDAMLQVEFTEKEQEDRGKSAEIDAALHQTAFKRTLDRVVGNVGSEHQLSSVNEPMLVTPFVRGDFVLLARNCSFTRWTRGVITSAHKNGTYTVQLALGNQVDRVPRILLRPDPEHTSRSGALVEPQATAEVCKLVAAKDAKGLSVVDLARSPSEMGTFEDQTVVKLLETFGKQTGTSDAMELDDEQAPEDRGLVRMEDKVLEDEYRKAVTTLEKELDAKQEVTPPKVSSVCQVRSADIRVLPVAEDGSYGEGFYNVLMTKVDVKEWPHGLNNFYSMQIVEDRVQELFILINHWGRIEEWSRYGKHQQTPFQTREDAVTEFRKVFRSKTGNDWNERDNFEKKPRKYKLMRTALTQTALPLPSARNTSVPSKLPEEVQDAVSRFVDHNELERAAEAYGLNEESLPLGRVSRETILEAEDILKQVSHYLEQIDEIQKAPKPQVPELLEAMDKVADLSNAFYEIMPPKEGDARIRPFSKRTLRDAFDLVYQLKDVSAASQMLMISHMKRNEANPLDFCLEAAGATLDVVPSDRSERAAIEQYFRNTQGGIADVVVSNVFEVHHVAGQPVSNDIGNHRLLWHGSPTSNIMGLLKDGLKIAPPEAPVTGHLFGKGIYCADKFSKSFPYCRATLNAKDKKTQPKAYLLLVEVALGQQKLLFRPEYVTELPDGFNSVRGVGKSAPTPAANLRLKGFNFAIPLGIKSSESKERLGTEMESLVAWSGIDSASSLRLNTLLLDPNTSYPLVVEGLKVDGEEETFRVEVPGPFAVNLMLEKEKSEDEEQLETTINPRRSRFIKRTVSNCGNLEDNEFIVYDKSQARIRYIVEVTSEKWLKNNAK